jgi:hypothetical protein
MERTEMAKFIETKDMKLYKSHDFNYGFNKQTGATFTYGVNKEHNPEVAPFPMIADIEITERCSGPGDGPCKFCYKANTANSGAVMSLDTFKILCDKLPRELTQIAFGVDAKLESNPEWYEIFKYARKSGFIPNATVANITQETANKLASVCGAVAVSRYSDKNWCYDSLARLRNAGLKFRNIHILVSSETIPWILETFEDFHSDERLFGTTAIVLLSLKKKGRGKGFTRCSEEDFEMIVDKAMKMKIPFGMDSCSAHKAMAALKKYPEYDQIKDMIEPCESSLASAYLNAEGMYFPCSFTEGTEGWTTGLDVVDCNNFIEDIWNHPRTLLFREMLLANERRCPIYNV